MGYAKLMNEDKARAWSWVIGALAVVFAAGLYLWLTAPGSSILSETYTVM